VDFDWGEIGRILAYIIPVVILLVVNVFFRKQHEQKRRLTVVKRLLSEINYNQELVEAFSFRWQTKKFKVGNWKRNKDKMDYIDQSLHATLAGAYEIAEEFNREIDAAKKHKSPGYLANIRVDRLTEPLARSKQGLEEWLRLNKGKEKIFRRSRDLTPSE
jgi:hypothetical protein